jgi:Holliday junction resolvasome RuvABC endonuclease subunit
VPVGTIKKAATGKGNASKADMIAAAKRAGCFTEDDNEADAFWIAKWAVAEAAKILE